jgi:hypothetical protein
MKKTKRFAAMIAALTMTACAGTMNLSAKAATGNYDHEDISLNPATGDETKDTIIHNGLIPTPGFESTGYEDPDGNLFYQQTIGGGTTITEQADAYLDLEVEVEGGNPDAPANAETAQVLSEDVWCIEITAPDCTWHVTNVAKQRYHIVRWNPNAQMYGIYMHEVQATHDETGQTWTPTADYIDVGGTWGTDDTVKTATFLNRSNFQVKLTAKVLNDGGDVTTDENNQPMMITGNNDGFEIKFRTKTNANTNGWDLFGATLVLNRPYTSYSTLDDGDENYYNVLDDNETQKGYLDMRLNPEAHFLENSANRTKKVLITFSKPRQDELVNGDSLYAPVQSTPYIYGYSDNGGEVTGSATAEQIAEIARNESYVGGDTVQNSHFEAFVVSDALFAQHKAAWEEAHPAAADNTDDPDNQQP